VTRGFAFNETRQCSHYFGEDAVAAFLELNNLTSIIRAHQACFEGYKFQFISKDEVPRVITIFSAPNYCDVYKNKAACIKFHDDILNIRQYSASPHPYYLPNFMDVISWSMPFLAEKVCEMLNNVLTFSVKQIDDSGSVSITEILEEHNSPVEKKRKSKILSKQNLHKEKVRKRTILRDKILAVTKMVHFYNVIQQENKNIVKLKALTPSGKLPIGILSKGSAAIAKELLAFTKAQEADKNNMKLPPQKRMSRRDTMRSWLASPRG